MKIVFSGGDRTYIVENNGTYYMVNIPWKRAMVASPSHAPDMFLRFGYWDYAENTSRKDIEAINEILLSGNYLYK